MTRTDRSLALVGELPPDVRIGADTIDRTVVWLHVGGISVALDAATAETISARLIDHARNARQAAT